MHTPLELCSCQLSTTMDTNHLLDPDVSDNNSLNFYENGQLG